MIPIVSIFNLVSGLIFVIISLDIYFSYRKNKNESVKNFLITFSCLATLLLLIATPGIVFANLIIISFIYDIYPFFGILALAYLSAIPLKIIGYKNASKIFFYLAVAAGILVTALFLFNLKPALVEYRPPFVYWNDSRGTILDIILGIIFGGGALMVALFFIIQGVKSAIRSVKIRSFLIAAGLISLIGTMVVNYIYFNLSSILFIKEYLGTLLATIFDILAGVLIFAGIRYDGGIKDDKQVQ